MLEGPRRGGARTVTIRYEDPWQQIEAHLQLHHGTSLSDLTSFSDLEHATIRAAVVFVMD